MEAMRSCPSGSQVVCWLVKSISFHAEVHPTLRVAPMDAHGSRSGTSYWGRPDSGARQVSKSNTCKTSANLPAHSMQILHLWTNDIPHILIDFNRIIWVCLRKKTIGLSPFRHMTGLLTVIRFLEPCPFPLCSSISSRAEDNNAKPTAFPTGNLSSAMAKVGVWRTQSSAHKISWEERRCRISVNTDSYNYIYNYI